MFYTGTVDLAELNEGFRRLRLEKAITLRHVKRAEDPP
jgi:hypothetical protein